MGYIFNPNNLEVIISDQNRFNNNFIATRIINVPPIANFTYSPANPTTEDTITFDANGSFDQNGDELTYSWYSDIDGLLGLNKIIKVTMSEGTHTITLNVSDNSSYDFIKKYLIVTQTEKQKESGSITISWQRSTNDNFDHYEIYISTDPEFEPSLETLVTRIYDINITTYNITNLKESVKYYSIVREVYKDNSYKESDKIPAVAIIPESKDDEGTTSIFPSLEYFIILLILIIFILIAIAGFVYYRRKRQRFEDYEHEVDNIYNAYLPEPKECKAKLQILQNRVNTDSEHGRLSDKHKMIIDTKIKTSIKKINKRIKKDKLEKIDSQKSTIQIKNIKKFLADLDQKYEFIKLIDTGGSSEVYEAKRRSDNQIVAIKVPFGVRSGEVIDKKVYDNYIKEIKYWKKLTKVDELADGVVKLHEFGKIPYPWIVMERMEGNLDDKVKSMSIKDKLNLSFHLLDVLGRVHIKGIVHRDIKPRNIMINKEGVWKFGDWGLSKEVLCDHTTTIAFKGTLAYSAPEQFDPEAYGKIDHRTDIYQFGVVIYELFTGKKPFEGQFMELSHKIINESPTAPSEINSKIPTFVNEAILKSLAKHKKNRWQYANDFMRALKKK